CHNYESAFAHFPPGTDANGYSTATHLLPYLEQDNLFRTVDFTKALTDNANAATRGTKIKVYLSPRDPIESVPATAWGATNYVYCAGTKIGLKDNDGVFYAGSKTKIVSITDGTSNTVLAGETLKGDGGDKPVTVLRQIVRLKAGGGQEGEAAQAGVAEWQVG